MVIVAFLTQELFNLGLSIHKLLLNITHWRSLWLVAWNWNIACTLESCKRPCLTLLRPLSLLSSLLGFLSILAVTHKLIAVFKVSKPKYITMNDPFLSIDHDPLIIYIAAIDCPFINQVWPAILNLDASMLRGY
jgi:hypothetical protein